MSIFIKEEIKKERVNYWRGLLIPIIVGLGISFLSMILLENLEKYISYSENIFIIIFLSISFHSGHLIIWPLLGWWIKSHAERIGDLNKLNGARISIKLYFIWILCFFIPYLWFATSFTGIV